MATITKGDKAPEGDVLITPAAGEQFSLSDGGSYETEDTRQVESLHGLAAAGVVKIEHPQADDSRESAEAEKETRAAARKRAREIEKAAEKGEFVPGHELTPVEGAPQSDPDAGAARDDQETGN